MNDAINVERIGVFFDLDKTLIKKSLFELFLRYCMQNKIASIFTIIPLLLLLLISKIMRNNSPIRYGIYRFVQGMNREVISQKWHNYIFEIIESNIVQITIDKLKEHKNKSHKLILVTNNLDFIADPIKLYFGFDLVITLQTNIDESGLILNDQKAFTNIGLDKAHEVLNISSFYNLDLYESYGYGDSVEDYNFLSIVGNPFVVKNIKHILPFTK